MPVNVRGRSLLTLQDFSAEEIRYLLDLASELKMKKRSGLRGDLLAGKNIVLIFEKTSTRTGVPSRSRSMMRAVVSPS